jgi:CSLREA domain-containing protein
MTYRFIAAVVATVILSFATATNAATFIVNQTADPGDGVCDASCTLRDAITAANDNMGGDVIDFSGIVLPQDTVPVTIQLSSGLPPITDTVLMDGSISETRVLPGNPTRRPGVELDLSLAVPVSSPLGFPLFPNGLSIFGPTASGTEIRGLVINGINRPPPLGLPVEVCFLPILNPDSTDPTTPALQFCAHTISIFGANNVQVSGNYLNLDVAGEVLDGEGVTAIALLDVSNAVIGGDSADDRNVMSSSNNDAGYDNVTYNLIQAWSQGWAAPAFSGPKHFNNNQIVGNYMAVTASGVALNTVARGIWLKNRNTPDLPSPLGGFITEGWGPQCGASESEKCEMQGNVIRGNTLTSNGFRSTFALFGGQQGSVVEENVTYNTDGGAFGYQGKMEFFENETGAPSNALVSSNRFGLDAEGNRSAAPAERGFSVGVADHIRVENNIIAGALFEGILIRDNSTAGLNTSLNVTLSQNAVVDSCLAAIPGCMGIDLRSSAGAGRTPNDKLDPDSGANHLQNYPLLLEIQPSRGRGSDKIVAELDSSPNEVYLIEFFSSSSLNGSGESEGERFIGQKTVSTDRNGHADFHFNYNERHNGGGGLATTSGDTQITYITATATRKHCEPQEPGCRYGSTSEFSPACDWNIDDREAVFCRE